MALEALQIDAGTVTQRDTNDIGRAPVPDRIDLVPIADDRFREEEARREIEILARRTQSHRHRLVANANLQRLLDDDGVVFVTAGNPGQADARDLRIHIRSTIAEQERRSDSLARISHCPLESFPTLFHREPFSPRGFLRGEKVPKADEGAFTRYVRSIDRRK